jgi:threonine dehydrogenase-like Zn-dependent dehydrogenase
MLDLLLGEKIIQGSAAHRWDTDVRTAVKLIAERTLDLTPLISKVYPLTEVKAALDNASNSPDEIIKVLIDCTPTGRASIEEE